MREDDVSESSGDAYEDVVNGLEEHYRVLFNDAYADACAYAHVLKTLHVLKRGLKQNETKRGLAHDREVAELERWFNGELKHRDGRERTNDNSESDTGTA